MIKHSNLRRNAGFTLMEMLLYISILTVVAGPFIGILMITTRVQVHEVANNEVSTQLNFVLQTVQRLVRESSTIEEVGTDNGETSPVELAYLKLRMPVEGNDPTCIALIDPNTITVTQGPGAIATDCKDPTFATENLITDKVAVPANGLTFTKSGNNAPGHDSVSINLTLDFNSTDPSSFVSRTVQSAIGRVSAATFDSSLVPTSGSSFDIGTIATKWKDLNLSGNLNVDGAITQGGSYGPVSRGFMVVGAINGVSCNSICGLHTSACTTSYKFTPEAADLELTNQLCTATVFTSGGLCFCN